MSSLGADLWYTCAIPINGASMYDRFTQPAIVNIWLPLYFVATFLYTFCLWSILSLLFLALSIWINSQRMKFHSYTMLIKLGFWEADPFQLPWST